MISKEFFKNAEEVANIKGISIEEVYEATKKGLVQSFKKVYGNSCCRAEINPEKTEILFSLCNI